MTVRWQTIALPFNSGVDTKTDSKSLEPPKLLDLQNAAFTEKVGFRKRYGSVVLPTVVEGGGSIDEATAVFTRDDELVLASGGKLYSYEGSLERWADRGDYVPMSVTQKTVSRVRSEQSNADRASNGGVTVCAWEDSRGTVRFSILDDATGAVIVHDHALESYSVRPRCLAVGDSIHLYFVNTDDERLRLLVIRPLDAVACADADPVTVGERLYCTTIVFDAKAWFDPTPTVPCYRALVAYGTKDSSYKVMRVEESGSVFGNDYEPYDRAVQMTAMSIVVHDNQAAVVIGEGAGIAGVLKKELFTLYKSGITFTSSTDLDFLWSVEGTTFTRIAAVRLPLADTVQYIAVWYQHVYGYDNVGHATYSNGTTLSSGYARHSRLISDAWYYDGHAYATIAHVSSLQATYIVERDDGLIVGSCLPGSAGIPASVPSTGAWLARVEESSTGKFSWAGLFKRRLDADADDGNAVFEQKGVKDITFDFTASPVAIQEGEALYLTGGMLWQYDGHSCVEAGFLVFPEIATDAMVDGAAAGTMGEGEYWYRFYYEWTNDAGERERSTYAYAVKGTVTSGKTQISTSYIPTLCHTNKTDVAVVGYRTEKNPSDGAPYYRVTNQDPTDTTGLNCYLANDKSADYLTFEDGMPDATLIMQELDYQNAERENVAPEPCSIIASGKGRVWLAGFENQHKVAYSKLRFDGDAVAFNDTQEIIVPRDGGEVTALAVLNDAMVIFKKSRVYLVSGDGPSNAEGDLTSFGEPQLVTSDAGCIEQRSVVACPAGVMFKSAKGIYLLDQSYRLTYIGADVEGYNDQDVTSATLLAGANQIRFLTSDGVTLVYDYLFGQWSTFTNSEGVGAVLWSDDYTFAEADGHVRVEDSSTYRDNTTAVVVSWTTAWVKLNTLQGYQRVRRGALLGEWKSDHKLRVEIAYDYEEIWSDVIEFDPSTVLNLEQWGDDSYWGEGSVWGGEDSTVYQFRFRIPRQKCEAIRFRFTDIPGSPAGESFQASELALEVGLMGGLHRMPAGKTL